MTADLERPPNRAAALGRAGPWICLASLWWWSGFGTPWALFVAATAAAAAAALARGRHGRWRSVGSVVATLAILVAFYGERQVGVIVGDWDGYWDRRVDEVGDLLAEELDRRQLDGEAAADELIALGETTDGRPEVSAVSALRARYRASAVALYGPEGTLIAWDGPHRGKVPESVQRGERRQLYRDLPLFGYFYLTSVGADGSVGVAAFLLRAALPEGLGADVGDLASRFYGETGERIRVTEEDPGVADAVWDLALDENRLLSVVLQRPALAERAATVRSRWAVRVATLAAVAWLFLALGGPLRVGEATVASLSLLIAAVSAPIDRGATFASLFDLAAYDLPGPWSVPVGRAAIVAATGVTLLAILPRVRFTVPAWLVGVSIGTAYPLLLGWLEMGLEPGFFVGGRTAWVAFHLLCASTLTLVTGFGLIHARDVPGSRRVLVVALGVATLLSAALAVEAGRAGDATVWWSTAWALPVALAAWSLQAWPGWQRSLLAWGTAAILAATATLPVVWGQSIADRLADGVERLSRVAAVEDPVLEDRLVAFGAVADSLDDAGAEDVTILYEGWRLSGLAELGYPVWLQIEERDGSPGEGLRVGVGDGEPVPYQQIVARGREVGSTHLVQLNEDDARYIVTTALADDRMMVAVAPPFPETSELSAMSTLLRGVRGAELDAFSVLPLPEGEEAFQPALSVQRTERGWRAEVGLRFSNGPSYHAYYTVPLPGLPLAVARATLLLVASLALSLAFVIVGRAMLGDTEHDRLKLSSLVISFRARVTLALFGFFALANALFGTVAYRTLAQASQRSAEVIAERVVSDASNWYRALGGQMERIASQVGAELIEYRDGELREGSLEELVELGLYEGWTPYAVNQALGRHETVQETTGTSVGRWEYVTAYRRLPDGDVLAAQVPLQEGTSALQTSDLVELLAFVVLLGAALSAALAMMAGRALTRPIRALQIASERVGAGDLELRLPGRRTDEFGAVFRAFNRMVGRVRRARRQLVRTSRRTQLIMDEAAVGMVALDPGGHVTLVNPRAEEFLGTEVIVGRRLPSAGALGEALTEWIDGCLEGRAHEADSDFEVGDRRIRVRARRLGSPGTRRGIVVALDDVTDELRAERVLAWGEMARQVAHEVKNPLTPIKLSIQHVRRAWDDDRPDFGEILTRNADAMLGEIDRLAEIAQSFSRFGAPGGQDVPLSPVFLSDVVSEVMALYGGSSTRVRFEADIERGLPPVVARATELKEVLINLLENARLAGREGTCVEMTARQSPAEPDRVLLSVRDDGVGIAPDVLPRIFEPQFSTRSKGTGLGLAIVQRVVTAWGGSLDVESTVGVGTTVTVALRAWEDETVADER